MHSEQPLHTTPTGNLSYYRKIFLHIYLHNFKKRISYQITTFAVAFMPLTMLVILLTVGKSGLMELVPIWLALILLFLVNFTGIYPVVDPAAPANQKVKRRKTAIRLAWRLAIFGAHEFYPNRYPRAIAHLAATLIGCLLCLDRFIGMGVINNIHGESAWIYLAAGISILVGSIVRAVCDALELRRGGNWKQIPHTSVQRELAGKH